MFFIRIVVLYKMISSFFKKNSIIESLTQLGNFLNTLDFKAKCFDLAEIQLKVKKIRVYGF